MPTPFSHLHIAQRLLNDPAVPRAQHDLLQADAPAFLLGGIAADQRTESGDREDTHFYRYDKTMTDHPWRLMLAQNPALAHPRDAAHRAFVAGYVAHLAADEFWSLHMLRPHFANAAWGENARQRFYVLHYLLAWMDERDAGLIDPDTVQHLVLAQPDAWLAFLDDGRLDEWRDYIAGQMSAGSETSAILSGRIQEEVSSFDQHLHDEAWMTQQLWQPLTPETVTQTEADMYDFSREQMLVYLDETAGVTAASAQPASDATDVS